MKTSTLNGHFGKSAPARLIHDPHAYVRFHARKSLSKRRYTANVHRKHIRYFVMAMLISLVIGISIIIMSFVVNSLFTL